MSRKITDAGVAGLAISEGRAELLEEIMATAPLATAPRATVPDPPRGSRWLPVVAAAAAVAVVAAGAMWIGNHQGNEAGGKDREGSVAAGPGDAELAVLDDAAWTLEDASLDEYGGELEYHYSGQGLPPDELSLTIKWSPSRPFDLYAEDTMEIDGPQVGQRLEVLGRKALLFRYDGRDHLAVLEVLDEALVEIRGEGMGESAFRDLLAQLTPIAAEDLDGALPDELVNADERPAVIDEMLDPLPLPPGFDRASVDSQEWQRYDIGSDVVAPVVCGWVASFVEGMRSGDDIVVLQAQAALATARDWPVLVEMKTEGDYPDVVWEVADRVVAGDHPKEYRQGLGC